MNRFDRIISILLQLQSKRVVTAQEIAKKHGISIRTVYRDIRSLEEGGIPIISDAGIGYSIVDGYHLPPIRFTKEEATAFLTAEKLVEKLTDKVTFDVYQSALFKIKAALKKDEKEHLETMDSHIEIVGNPYLTAKPATENHLQEILRSITLKQIISITYFNNSEQSSSQRQIEPVGIYYMSSRWYLVAYCWLRKDYRTFRVDRIEKISATSKTFEKKHKPLKEFLKEITSKQSDLHTVVINFDKDVIKYLGEQQYYHGFVSQKELDHAVEMTFLASSIEGFARWYVMYGDHASIVKPAVLKTRVKEIIKGIQKKIS